MIITEKQDVRLREFEESDIPLKVEWINDVENNLFLHYDLPLDIEKTTRWFRSKDNSRRVDCMIEYMGIPVGVIGLLQIDRENLKAEYYITIGNKSFKKRGIATLATEAILNYAFKDLGLHKVYLTVDARNDAAIRLYEKVGFKQEGYFVDDLYCARDSEFIDRTRYAIMNGGVKLYYEVVNPIYKIPKTFIQKLRNADDNNDIYMMREDLIPVSFGGNKARKAAYFFRAIELGNYDCIVTYGSTSSNHCRVISNMAASKGLPCYIIGPQESKRETYNSQMMRMFGAEIELVPVDKVHDTIENKLEQLRGKGCHPYFIPGGGHGNLGTQAYVDCYKEIEDFEASYNVHFDYIFLASGTGTTQAGLICGKLLRHDNKQIVGISIARKNPRGREIVMNSVYEFLGNQDAIEENTIFLDKYTSDGYGDSDIDIEKTIDEMMEKYGIPMDSTYTGKAYCGMKKFINENRLSRKNILFIHTGGTPLFFDELKKEVSNSFRMER